MEIIYDDIVEYYHDEINRISKNKEKFYQIFDIPKKNGRKRHIAQPLSELKQLQKIFYKEIFYPKSYLIPNFIILPIIINLFYKHILL